MIGGMVFRRQLFLWIVLSSAAALAGCGPKYERLLTPAKFTQQSPAVFHARFETTKGTFVIEVHRDWAPLGADRFYNLVCSGYYDGQRFFRTLPKFVVQWGLCGNPAVSKAWQDEKLRLQDEAVKQSNTRGFVTFAKSGPNTRTTQIYVNMADNSRLDATGFSPFGRVTEGMEVFEKLYAEYGDVAPRGKGPEQQKIRELGDAYLAKDFPLLDRILKARVVGRQ
jgi:peptidyl-prolyl cis-trans isomerase A (cyclophilin A)